MLLNRTTGVLPCFGTFAEIAQIRVDVPLERSITAANNLLDSSIGVRCTQLLKLIVRVKN